MRTHFLLCLTGSLWMIGCNTSKKLPVETAETKTRQEMTRGKTSLVWTQQKPGERQTLVRMDTTGAIRVLAAQSPGQDFLKNTSLDSTIKINGSLDANQLVRTQKEMMLLQNRSVVSQLNCEALYRLSEAYFNGFMDSSKYEELYLKTIVQPLDLIDAEIELEEAKTETILAETEKVKVELQKLQLQLELLKLEKGIKEEKAVVSDSLQKE